MEIFRNEIRRLASLLVCMVALFPAEAEEVTVGGLNYFLFSDSQEACLVNKNTWKGELDIPTEISYNGQTYAVKSISWLAFGNCTELTKVRIPKTIERVIHHVLSGGNGRVSDDCMNPFAGCTALESIEVDEDNPIFKAVDGILFSKDGTRLYSYPGGMKAESYTVPDSVTWIGETAFSFNPYLENVTIPNSVTRMGGGVFEKCKSLKFVKLSESISIISAYTFDRCESLHFLDIPEHVSDFGESVFRWSPIKTLVIRGTFPDGFRYDTFYRMDDEVVIYVQESEIEKLKKALKRLNTFSGTVLPLDSYDFTSVNSIHCKSDYNSFFDLQGRRLTDKPASGVYIQNGKKRVVK